ncbi:MAG: hypothetical protein ACO3QV_07905 [Candidatus Nanopelagicaceae bacterium]|jgi:hypothetical protein
MDDPCLDCLDEDDFDNPDIVDVDDLLDEDDNLTDAGYDYLALLERFGHLV